MRKGKDMVAQYKQLSDILAGIGLDSSIRESVLEYGEWENCGVEIALINPSTVKKTLLDFVEFAVEEFDDVNELFLDANELKYNVNDIFSTVPSGYYIDVNH